MNNYKSAVIRQVANGFVMTVYLPDSTGATPGTETETYFADINSAAAVLAAVL